uniref:EGF-like domain-containing protein n=1 Tax=Clytia hemisphaerica TaxID=252671 RepID=A0A7M5UPN8_9CNID
MLIKVLIFVCWLVYSVNSSGKNETGLDPTGENVCTRTIKYFVNKTQLYMRQVLVPYYDCDGISIFGDCPFWAQTKKFRSESKSSVKNVLVVRTKNISECCPGYQQYNSSCPTAVCKDGCLNGVCVAPNKCLCSKGYTGPTCNQDHNECLVSNGGCSHACINTKGSFLCSCPIGWILKDDKKTCEDHDECLVLNGGCSHACINTKGSFLCSCPIGWILKDDKKTCEV